ncbi:hypothetical protein FRC18_004392 [Serendipita sp. 400]|nr:hypothetical protein FRC18_004392 [Serendipita sp. 400]
MSRLTRSRSQSPSKSRLKTENAEKTRLERMLSVLGSGSGTERPPTMDNIESLYGSRRQPQLMLLCDHIVGRSHATHVRRNIQELQKSNLPMSILKEVLSPTLLDNRALDDASKGQRQNRKLLRLKEMITQLESETASLTDQLNSANADYEGIRVVSAQLRDLERAAEALNARLEQFYVNFRQNDSTSKQDKVIQEILNTQPNVPKSVQEAINKENLEQNAAIVDLLDQAMDQFSTDASISSPLITRADPACYRDTIMTLQTQLILYRGRESRTADVKLDSIPSDLPIGVSRVTISELSASRVRRRLFPQGDIETGQEVKDEQTRIIENTKGLYMQVKHQLEVVQRLMLETYNLINEIPKQLHEDFYPFIDSLQLALSTLDKAIFTRKDDIVLMNSSPSSFREDVCAALGLPEGSSQEDIVRYVQERVGESI